MPNTIVDFSRLFSSLSYDRVVDIKDQWFPPKPTFTEANLERQDGRVFIITGGNSGIGLALTKFLYPTGAKIYLACRSEERAKAAMKEIVDEYQAAMTSGGDAQKSDPGELIYMHLDLNDLRTIKSSAAFFTQRETRLDILWNNAGVAGVPTGTKTAQNIEGHIGVNCVGPLLFTQELIPRLRAAAKVSPPAATRVIWSSSMIIERFAPDGGVDFSELDRMNAAGTGSENASVDYAMSKAGNWFLAVEGARRWGSDGILSVTQNPGMINTTVWKHQPNWLMAAMVPTFHSANMGACTMMFAGFSGEVGLDKNGVYILPFGRVQEKNVRGDIVIAIESGKPKEFWEWCERLYELYV
ncbi:hypothetical protein VMCG_10362 [Cytospora schulzeri]|uniref:Uncharacterized protein n=1 Tax=Cytospora schulzeri TaxID=448051 RepID=A0A423VFL0_9PEZI|nr:hypothetical protein VMCG_10362 [Valsa malicola]